MSTYELTQPALKELQKLPKNIRRRIIKKLDYYVVAKNPLIFADRLINYDIGQYRFRIGDYRIIFDVEGDILVILSVGHRKDIYR